MEELVMPTNEFKRELKNALNMCSDLTDEQKDVIIEQSASFVETADKFSKLKSLILGAVRIAVELKFSRVTMELMIMDSYNATCEENNRILKVI